MENVKRRLIALSLGENEELAEVVKQYPCLYNKAKKEYKDKAVVENSWKKVAEKLDFIEDGMLFLYDIE